MKVSVILCTFNRAQSLAEALASVAASEVPPSVEWEVLVVDNNSNDRTKEVIGRFCSEHPSRFRYLFEARPGKSHALNAGIRATSGDVIAFVDDDVVVEADWLANLTNALDVGRWSGSGGKILPRWESTPPRWLPRKDRYALAPLAMFDPGCAAGALDEPPFGTNMAFRREMFEKHGNFRVDLGPRPGSEIRNEDTEFGQRLLDRGEPLRYEPSAVVHHAVSPGRLRKQYFLKWWYDKGRADIREFGIRPGTRWFAMGMPLYLVRRLVMSIVRWMAAMEPSLRFERKTKVWGKLGEIAECRVNSDRAGLVRAGGLHESR